VAICSLSPNSLDQILGGELDVKDRAGIASQRVVGLLREILLVDHLEVEVVVEQRHGESNHCLGEGLAQTDSLTAKEGVEHEGVSLATIWLLEVLRLVVEAVRNEPMRLDPLLRVVMKGFNGDTKLLIRLDIDSAHVHVLREAGQHGRGDGRFNAQRLVEDAMSKLKLLSVFVREFVLEIASGSACLQSGHHF